MNELEHESLLEQNLRTQTKRPLNISKLKILRKYRLPKTNRIANLVLGALLVDLSKQFYNLIDLKREYEQDLRLEQRRDD